MVFWKYLKSEDWWKKRSVNLRSWLVSNNTIIAQEDAGSNLLKIFAISDFLLYVISWNFCRYNSNCWILKILTNGHEADLDLPRLPHNKAWKIVLMYGVFHINCHEADLVFGCGLPHKINNFDETWVENAQPRILISDKFFHINASKHEFLTLPHSVLALKAGVSMISIDSDCTGQSVWREWFCNG